jgi:hypothetical protein
VTRIQPSQGHSTTLAATGHQLARSEGRSLLPAERRVVPLSARLACLLVNECCGFGERRAAQPRRAVRNSVPDRREEPAGVLRRVEAMRIVDRIRREAAASG